MENHDYEEDEQDEQLIEIPTYDTYIKPYLSEEQRIELEAELFGRKALDKLYELDYAWNGYDWEKGKEE